MTMQPEAVAIAVLIGFPAIQLVGALLARPHYRTLLKLADEVSDNPEATDDDRAAVAISLQEAGQRWPIWLIALTAPLWALPLLISAIVDLIKESGKSPEQQDAETLKAFDALQATLADKEKPVHSKFYNEVCISITDHMISATAKSQFLLTAWIAVWAAPSVLVFFAFGAVDLARQRFRWLVELSWSVIERARARLAA